MGLERAMETIYDGAKERRMTTLSIICGGEPSDDRAQLRQQYQGDVQMTRLIDAVSQKQVCPRSSLGQQFAACHKKGTPHGGAYRSLGRADAAEFRLKWAQEKLKYAKQGREYSETWRRTDKTLGRRIPFCKMVIDQGFNALAVVGALKTVYKCSLMGSPWCERHPQTERLEYMLLEFGFSEEFEKAWRRYTHEFDAVGEQVGPNPKARRAQTQARGARSTTQ